MTLDLRALPDIVFADSNTARVESSVIAVAEGILERTLYPGDPLRLFLEGVAYVISQQRAVIDFTGKQNLLRYAVGPYLDQLGSLFGIERLGQSPSLTTLEFTLSEVLPYDAVIPAATRATADGQVFFASTEQAIIRAGELTTETPAVSLSAGTNGNGLLPGQINKLVDPLPFPLSVRNSSTSNSGSGVETDSHLRERIQLAPESFSTAGPEQAYRFWAISAHSSIADVAVLGPPDTEPGHVDLRVLLRGGQLPTQEILDLVLETMNADKRRPLTDYVTADAPELAPFKLEVKWWVLGQDAALLTSIRTAVENAVAGWLEWQQGKIGRDLNPSELTRRMVQAGAKRVEITSPVFTDLGADTVARLEGEAAVTYAGTESV